MKTITVEVFYPSWMENRNGIPSIHEVHIRDAYVFEGERFVFIQGSGTKGLLRGGFMIPESAMTEIAKQFLENQGFIISKKV